MMLSGQNNKSILLLSLAIFITRLPFLFAGYGSEEDAWGLILVSRNIDLTGIYEVSRMPGHPVQEIFLSLIWDLPSWCLTLITAIVSTTGIYYFMLTLRLWGIRNYLTAGILLAFVPVIYVNSTNVMDYTWALSFVMIAMYQLVQGRIILAGVILGIACGFRITSGAMVIPFAVLLIYRPDNIKNILFLGITTSVTAILCYIPAIQVYGTGFFTYYEYFPYPPFLKNVYKATIGAWGVPGMLALVIAVVAILKSQSRLESTVLIKPLLWMSFITIALFTYSFLRIPQKSAFVIPMIPFIIIIITLFLNDKQLKLVTALMICSCFLFGINLDDKLRGSSTSLMAFKTTIGNTPIAIDPLVGIVTADHLKRKQKIGYAKEVVNSVHKIKMNTVIIAGWWQNELNYFSLENKNPKVSYVYYADENQLKDSISTGNKIFYLPEQNFYNDLRFNKQFTNKIAAPFDQLIAPVSF